MGGVMSEHTIFYEGMPVAKPRMTQRDKWAKRPAVLRYREYCDALRQKYQEGPELAGAVVHMRFGFAPPKSWSKKRVAQMLGVPHRQKPDIDNLVKGVLDALFVDDSGVHRISASKFWAVEAHVAITVVEDG
jgi:Holliday junction resolvase RusA-like endonuclease